ncbi:MAG: acetate kinase [Cyanophyceae cyanobacterium]
MKILVLNAGSSSQKSCLYDLSDNLPDHPPKPLWQADIDWTGSNDEGKLTVEAQGSTQEISLNRDDRTGAIATMLMTLTEGETEVIAQFADIDIVGHRVVHGGSDYSEATLITPTVKAAIASLIPLAPSHNPVHLEGIEAVEMMLPNLPQLAMFDTAFHAHMPPEAAIYPIPYEWYEKGVRRYGFHGISHKYCAGRAAQLLARPLDTLKLVTCHLGNGCSLAAIQNGMSVNTTMGFTPLEGLMMGTRSGSIDPAISLYLMREHHLEADQIDRLLNKESGLQGISGISGDMRQIQQQIDKGNKRAMLALDMYVHRLCSQLGSMIATLGGVDALVFTAGIGEHSATVRELACNRLRFLGLQLDPQKNAASPADEDIATPDSAVQVLIIHAEEDWAIAQECWHYDSSQQSAE